MQNKHLELLRRAAFKVKQLELALLVPALGSTCPGIVHTSSQRHSYLPCPSILSFSPFDPLLTKTCFLSLQAPVSFLNRLDHSPK